ncbi:MAG: prolipoprotein diacylglyceryl transferase [Erysipelotrichaceae bacterium]
MEFFPSMAVFVKIGPVEIRWYAVCILTGALLAYYLSCREAKADKYESGVLDDLFIGILLFGIIGARLWYCIFYDFQGYFSDPLSIIAIWDGGLAIHGGILGGLLFGLVYCKLEHYQLFHLTDIILPNVLLAQAIGRWGNYFNQEAYGNVVSERYFDGILSFLKQGMYIKYQYRQPMFFYESVLCIIGFILIKLYLKQTKPQRGKGTFAYLSWYGAIRFWIETQRSDSLMLGNLKMAMIVSIVFMLIGIPGMLGAYSKLINKKKPVIIFDLDGTLIDSNQCIINSFKQVFKNRCPDLVLTEEDCANFLGPTLEESFMKHCPEASKQQIEEMVEEYRLVNQKLHNEYVKAMPNAKELLDYLKENGYTMAIASSKKTDTVNLGLQVSGLEGYFDTIVGVEQVYNHKPDKECLIKVLKQVGGTFSNAVYIGDSASDIVCAKNAGCYSIGYTSNKVLLDKLTESKPNAMVDDLLEVEEILKQPISFSFNLR